MSINYGPKCLFTFDFLTKFYKSLNTLGSYSHDQCEYLLNINKIVRNVRKFHFPKNDEINYNIREEFNLIEYFSSNNQPIFEPELKFLELEELVRTQHKRLEYHAIFISRADEHKIFEFQEKFGIPVITLEKIINFSTELLPLKIGSKLDQCLKLQPSNILIIIDPYLAENGNINRINIENFIQSCQCIVQLKLWCGYRKKILVPYTSVDLNLSYGNKTIIYLNHNHDRYLCTRSHFVMLPYGLQDSYNKVTSASVYNYLMYWKEIQNVLYNEFFSNINKVNSDRKLEEDLVSEYFKCESIKI